MRPAHRFTRPPPQPQPQPQPLAQPQLHPAQSNQPQPPQRFPQPQQFNGNGNLNSNHTQQQTYQQQYPSHSSAAPSAAPSVPPSAPPSARPFLPSHSFDEDFGDGSDLMEFDEFIVTKVDVKHMHNQRSNSSDEWKVKSEFPTTNPLPQPIAQPPPPPPPVPLRNPSFERQPSTTNPTAAATPIMQQQQQQQQRQQQQQQQQQQSSTGTFQSRPIHSPQIPQAPSTNISHPNNANSTIQNQAESVPSTFNKPVISRAFSSHSTSAPAPSSSDARIAALEAALSEKTGESQILRNRLEAFERRRVAEAAARAANGNSNNNSSTSNGLPFSLSQLPSSQSSHQLRKQENETHMRYHHQLETVKAEKESTEMQLSESLKENTQLRQRMEALEKLQLQLQAQLKQAKANPTAPLASPINHSSSNQMIPPSNQTALHQPDPSHPMATTPRLPLPHSHTVAAGATSGSSHDSTLPATSFSLHTREVRRWRPPTFLAHLSIRPQSTTSPPLITPIRRIDIESFTRLLSEFQQVTTSLVTNSNDLFDRLTQHVLHAMRMILHETASITCLLLPLRQLLLTSTILIDPIGIETLTPPSTTPPAPIDKKSASLSALSSSSKTSSNAPAAGWERSVRVKSEHHVTPSTSFPLASSSTVDSSSLLAELSQLHTKRDMKQIRQMQSTLLRLLHFCITTATLATQQLYDEFINAPDISTSTNHAVIPTTTTDPSKFIASHWHWQSVNNSSSGTTSSSSSFSSPDSTPLQRLLDSMRWPIVITKLFDEALGRLYADRADKPTNSNSSASITSALSLTHLTLLTTIIHHIASSGLPSMRFHSPSRALDTACQQGVDSMVRHWVPRLITLVVRIHSNDVVKYPIRPSNASTTELSIHEHATRLLSHWCRFAPIKSVSGVLQAASSIYVPDQAKLNNLELTFNCSCSILQLLMLNAMRQTNRHSLHSDFSAHIWYEVLFDLIGSAHRLYSQSDAVRSPMRVCPMHRREFGELENEQSLTTSSIALFSLPFAFLRILLAALQEAVAHFEICSQQQLATFTDGTFDHAMTTSEEPTNAHACTLIELSSALRLIVLTLRISSRRWKDVQTDPNWLNAVNAPRVTTEHTSVTQARIDLLLQELFEGCSTIRQCQTQLRSTSPEYEKQIRHGYEKQAEEVSRMATEIVTWFTA